MNNKKRIFAIGGVVVGVVTVPALAFYWFEWRPIQIRKDCAKLAIDSLKGSTSGIVEQYDFLYRACLQKRGL